MIEEIYELVLERLNAAHSAPASTCRSCAIEELEEVLQIIREVCYLEGEELDENRN